jgi:hypothetical protein
MINQATRHSSKIGKTGLVELLLVICLTPIGRRAVSQQRVEPTTIERARTGAEPTNCENHIAVLEAANDEAGRDGLLIVIARRGINENKRNLNPRRLYNARAYLVDYVNVRAPEKIVTAEGEPVNGFGRIELYVGGKLFHVLGLRRNADLVVGSCEPEALDDPKQRALRMRLYPWRDRSTRPS